VVASASALRQGDGGASLPSSPSPCWSATSPRSVRVGRRSSSCCSRTRRCGGSGSPRCVTRRRLRCCRGATTNQSADHREFLLPGVCVAIQRAPALREDVAGHVPDGLLRHFLRSALGRSSVGTAHSTSPGQAAPRYASRRSRRTATASFAVSTPNTLSSEMVSNRSRSSRGASATRPLQPGRRKAMTSRR
jgi:hypothetical protein